MNVLPLHSRLPSGKLHRRELGEAVESLAGSGEDHGMAGNFQRCGAEVAGFGQKIAADIPTDVDRSIALCVPRPVFITGLQISQTRRRQTARLAGRLRYSCTRDALKFQCTPSESISRPSTSPNELNVICPLQLNAFRSLPRSASN